MPIVDFALGAAAGRDFVDAEGLIRLLTDSLQSANVVEVLRDRIPQAWQSAPSDGAAIDASPSAQPFRRGPLPRSAT